MTTTIFRAARVVTMTGAAAEAFAVTNERVVGTGSLAEMRQRFLAAEVVDFGSATIVPGFNDAHAHLAVAAEDMLHLDLSMDAVSSLGEIFAKLREAKAQTPDGGWIRVSRYD